jgi:hypothetical protein
VPNWRWFQKLGFSVGVCGFATGLRRPGCQRLDTPGGTGRNENRKSRPISRCLRLGVSISIHEGWRVSLFCSRSAAADLLVRTAVMRHTGEDHLVRKRERPESLMPGPPLPDTPVVTRAPGPSLKALPSLTFEDLGSSTAIRRSRTSPSQNPIKPGLPSDSRSEPKFLWMLVNPGSTVFRAQRYCKGRMTQRSEPKAYGPPQTA